MSNNESKPIEDIKILQEKLATLAAESIKNNIFEFDESIMSSQIAQEYYELKKGVGKRLYRSYTEEDFIKILRERAEELGHVPAQKEMFWVYRRYIKTFFGNWPKALIAAGMSKRAGVGGTSFESVLEKDKEQQKIIDKIRKLAIELERPPHIFEVPEAGEFFKDRYKTWSEVLDLAGVQKKANKDSDIYKTWKVNDLDTEEKDLLKDIWKLAVELGRPPMRSEVSDEVKDRLKIKCKTWRNILFQLDLKPIQNIDPFSSTLLTTKRKQMSHRDMLERSVFKLVQPDRATVIRLSWIKNWAIKYGRSPIKKEIPENIYAGLIEQCKSYRNILYQIDLTPLPKEEAKEIERELRRQARSERK